MRTKAKLAVLLLVLAVASVVAFISASKAKPKPTRQQISELEEKERKAGLVLKERALLAKLKGEQKITYTAWSLSSKDYVSFSGVDAALAVYTVVVAQPVAETTYVSREGEIVTNYKFRTLETISEPPPNRFAPGPFDGEVRAELLPLESGEFVVGRLGGTSSVDGVEVTAKFDDFEQFSLFKPYLLFLSFDSTKRVGGMEMGPLSALAINEDGTLGTLDRRPDREIKRGLEEAFGDSAALVKAGLKRRAKSLKQSQTR